MNPLVHAREASHIKMQLHKLKSAAGAVGSNGKSLIGSMYALDMIYEQQHPKECDAANFLLWVPVRHGIGKPS